MGFVTLLGVEIIIGIAIGLILTLIGLFFGNISLFESIATGIILGVVVHKLWNFHPVFSIVVGIAAVVVLYLLQNTSVGFWIVGGLYSVAWGFIVGFIVFSALGKNMTYTYIGWAIGAAAFLGLHLIARSKQTA
jgi:hypothetical protein